MGLLASFFSSSTDYNHVRGRVVDSRLNTALLLYFLIIYTETKIGRGGAGYRGINIQCTIPEEVGHTSSRDVTTEILLCQEC